MRRVTKTLVEEGSKRRLILRESEEIFHFSFCQDPNLKGKQQVGRNLGEAWKAWNRKVIFPDLGEQNNTRLDWAVQGVEPSEPDAGSRIENIEERGAFSEGSGPEGYSL